ncbi:SDR family oxidoreductase [Aquimarina sp. ERC-38]|uniref:SDR family oxidoreductase n=1 Tax=Aquimarina sp. ERC-38 TaxID=2949996 RepID=UPI00224624FA|nr:SDR family oxidoreductase [Aquimarina sp. ERC-38]UZO82423.1 SDR family oxidoreductase [Aquimarina sp. ERC-38]
MNIILTGATGTLGSRILYELFLQKGNNLQSVFLLVRDKNHTTGKERIVKVLKSEFAPPCIKNHISDILKKIVCIEEKNFFLPHLFLKEKNFLFIHSAGYVNLSVNESQNEDIINQNLQFTKKLYRAYKNYIQKFVFISTAFSIGNVEGFIENDYSTYKVSSFRNAYEESKHHSEIFLTKQCLKDHIQLQILRPSVLGGNTMDAPESFISRYMVFFLFAKFFYHADKKDSIRIVTNASANLNIIPNDYAAKVIVKVLDANLPYLNITHKQGTNIIQGISKILDSVGFSNYSFVNSAYEDMNDLEKFYYKTIGNHLNPYLTSRSQEWDTELLEEFIQIPDYNLLSYLSNNIKYAVTMNFKSQNW